MSRRVAPEAIAKQFLLIVDNTQRVVKTQELARRIDIALSDSEKEQAWLPTLEAYVRALCKQYGMQTISLFDGQQSFEFDAGLNIEGGIIASRYATRRMIQEHDKNLDEHHTREDISYRQKKEKNARVLECMERADAAILQDAFRIDDAEGDESAAA